MIRHAFFALILSLTTLAANSQQADITTCRNPAGKAYRHLNGVIDKRDAGWVDEKINDGVLTLVLTANGSIDILFIDVRSKPISITQEGATIIVLRSTDKSFSLLAHYPGSTTEIYSFFIEKDGRSKYSVLTSRTGPQAVVETSRVMVGQCDPIRFDLLPRG